MKDNPTTSTGIIADCPQEFHWNVRRKPRGKSERRRTLTVVKEVTGDRNPLTNNPSFLPTWTTDGKDGRTEIGKRATP